MEKILIIGLGLIGGSLALNIKENTNDEVIGFDADPKHRQEAEKRQLTDQIVDDYQQAAKSADVIILAVPVQAALQLLDELAQIPLKQRVIITDTGSTKQTVMAKAAALPTLEANFIGGHPMAGSHKSGPDAARSDLFENAYYFLTPAPTASPEKIERLKKLLAATDSKFIVAAAKDHDEVTSNLSHIPHIMAAGLVNQTRRFSENYPEITRLAAGGFKDITRIASSDPVMWTDILLTNREAIHEQLTDWQEVLAKIQKWLETRDQGKILQFFEGAKATRDTLPKKAPGVLPSFYDLFVDIPDRAGSISDVTLLLAKADLSLVNIRILETREEINGILHLTFRSQSDQQKAERTLREHGFSVKENVTDE